MNPQVAFQGEPGAFSEEAVQQLFPSGVTTIPCPSFESLFSAVSQGRADFALAPLQNTLAGHVIRCYDLLYESALHIRAEVVRPIHHCLIGTPEASLADVKTVQSHPVALAQCKRLFTGSPHLRCAVADDTAGSVRQIMERGDRSVAAIAGAQAARIYGAQILRENVEDAAENFTRFVLLGSSPVEDASADKCSLVLRLQQVPGRTRDPYELLTDQGIHVASVYHRPQDHSSLSSLLFLDLLACDPASREAALRRLHAIAIQIRVLGWYRSTTATSIATERTHHGHQPV